MARWLSRLECSRGMQEVLVSSPGRAMCFLPSPPPPPPPVTFGGSVWVRAQAASSKGTVSSVPARFRADSGTNLFKQVKFSQVDRVAL